MLMHEALFLAIFVCLVGFFAGVLAVLIIYFLSDYKFHSWPKKLVIDIFFLLVCALCYWGIHVLIQHAFTQDKQTYCWMIEIALPIGMLIGRIGKPIYAEIYHH